MLFRNTAAQTAALVTGYLFSLILAPFMLSQLGLALFGVWAATGAVTLYAGIMNLGVTRAISRFVALYTAKDDRRSVEECFTLGLLTVTAVVAVAMTVALVAAGPLTGALGDVLSPADMQTVLLCTVGIFGVQAYRAVLLAVPQGMQQFVPPNLALIGGSTINFAFSLAALLVDPSLVTYALANLAAEAVGLLLGVAALRHVWSPVRVRLPSRLLIKEVLSYSLKSQVAWVSELFNRQADKVIIAIVIDVRAAGAYEIANRVVAAVKAVAALSVSAMVPMATARIVEEGTGMIADFFRRYTPRSLGVSLPLLVVATVTGPVALTAWLGDVPPNAVAIFVVLTLANCAVLTTGVAHTLTLSEGRAGLLAKVSLTTAAINLVCTIVLTPLFGLWGVIGGTLVAAFAGVALFLRVFHRIHGLRLIDYVRGAGLPAAVAGAAGLPIVAVSLLIDLPADERLPAAATTIGLAVLYLAIYWPLADRADVLPDRLRLGPLKRSLTRLRGRKVSPDAT